MTGNVTGNRQNMRLNLPVRLSLRMYLGERPRDLHRWREHRERRGMQECLHSRYGAGGTQGDAKASRGALHAGNARNGLARGEATSGRVLLGSSPASAGGRGMRLVAAVVD